jgi:energy-coupling factor transporter ATP-binding protein EcfA2
MAEQGCGKSTLTKMAQQIIDPYKGQPSVMPPKKDDLFAILTNSYFVAFDNTDMLSKEISDILCSAVTGATMQKRKLYTTNELGLYELHNTLVLNGIDIVPTQSDLASRCLLLKLKAISEKERMTDTAIKMRFQSALPEILGAIFNILSEAMTIIQNIHPTKMPRMAESYMEMLAIAVAMGVSESRFEAIYNANLVAMDKARADVAIVEAVKEYMESPSAIGRKVTGTATELFNRIRVNYSGNKNDVANNASSFSRKLRREYRVLFEAGYTVNFDDTGASSTRIEIIKNK